MYREQELLERLTAGEEKSFQAIQQRFRKYMYTMAYLRFHRTDIAEDLVQDIFTQF